MRQNEFNEVKVTNEGASFRHEFTVAQKSEYSDKKDNSYDHVDDINEQKVNNDQLLADKEEKKEEIRKEDNDQSSLEKQTIETPSSTSPSASSSGASSSSSSSSAVSGGGASAVSSTVATAASVIAVVSVSAVAGISVMQNTNAKCTLRDLQIFTDRIEYALVLENIETDNFVIKVNNKTYENKKSLQNGENTGEFIGLSQGETYSIVVEEDVYGGKTLYDGEFTTSDTKKEEPPYVPVVEFKNLTINQDFNWDANKFTVQLDYIDEADAFNDFQLTVKDLSTEKRLIEEPTEGTLYEYAYQLAKSTEEQSLDMNFGVSDEPPFYEIFPEDELEFTLTCLKDGNRLSLKTISNFMFNPKEEGFTFDGFSSTWELNDDFMFSGTLSYRGTPENALTIGFIDQSEEHGYLYTAFEVELETTTEVQEISIGPAIDERSSGLREFIYDDEFIANAMMRTDEFNEFFETDIEDEDVETLGGFVVKLLGHIAMQGDSVDFKNFTFTVLEIDGARIVKLKIKRNEIQNQEEEES